MKKIAKGVIVIIAICLVLEGLWAVNGLPFIGVQVDYTPVEPSSKLFNLLFSAASIDAFRNELAKEGTTVASYSQFGGRTPLSLAVEMNRLDVVKLFVSSGVDVNGGSGAAMRVVVSPTGSPDIARYLLAHGADPRLKGGPLNDSACEQSQWDGSPEIRRIIQQWCDQHPRAASQPTATHPAATRGHPRGTNHR